MVGPERVTREEWGARDPKRTPTKIAWSDRRGFTLHHSTGPTGQRVRAIQDYHMDVRGWIDIGYNMLADVAGRLYTGRGWTAQGAHADGFNITHVGLCLIGDFRDGHDTLTEEAKRTVRWAYDEACRLAGRKLAMTVHGGLPGQNTECPGDQVTRWVAAGMPAAGWEDEVTEAEIERIATATAEKVLSSTVPNINPANPDGTPTKIKVATVLSQVEDDTDVIKAELAALRGDVATLTANGVSTAFADGIDELLRRLEGLEIKITGGTQ